MALLAALASYLTLTNVLAAVAAACALLYWYCTLDFGKYEAMGLEAYKKPTLFLGNQKDVVMMKTHFQDMLQDMYKKFKGRSCGVIYEGSEACIFLRDLDLIKQVMIRDFDHFTDFGFQPEYIAKMSVNDLGLVFTHGDEWKNLRHAVNPAFSLKNLKNITADVDEMASDMVASIRRKGSAPEVEFEAVAGDFAMDCIARLVFSMNLGAADNPDNEFLKKGANFVLAWRFLMSSLFPKIMYLLNISMFNPVSFDYFLDVARKMIADRERTGGAARPDVLGLMMKAKETSTQVTNDVIAKTLMQFFLDGYDTVATAVAWCYYFLAVNPDVQERAREEVDEVAARCGGHLKGEDGNQLKYLDQVFNEALRMTSLPVTWRICTRDWAIPGQNVTVKKGTRVQIPIMGLHMDPELFPDPHTFDPDRFGPDRKSEIRAGSFIPFGLGPRQCMGMKIARLEAKVLMFQILRNFRLERCDKTVVPIKWTFDHLNRMEGGIVVRCVPRTDQ